MVRIEGYLVWFKFYFWIGVGVGKDVLGKFLIGLDFLGLFDLFFKRLNFNLFF